MGIYLINIILIVFFGFIFIHINPSDTKKKIYCVICATQWILLSGLRHLSIGNDTYQFNFHFQQGLETPWSTVVGNFWDYLFNGLDTKDPGYFLLQKIFQIFSQDYRTWLFFIAIVFTGLMARWIYKYSVMPDISFLVYSVLFFAFYSVTGHRQTLATALIVFLGYEFAKKRQFIKFAIVAFIAFTLHKSSVVFIVYYFLANISITPIYVLLFLLGSLVFAFVGRSFYGPIAVLFGFTDEQAAYEGGGAGTYATVLILLCIVTVCFYPWISKRRSDVKYLYNMILPTFATTLLVYSNQNFMRIQQYFSLIIMILIPELIQAVDKNYRVLAYLFVVGFLCGYFLLVQPQYRFFFM